MVDRQGLDRLEAVHLARSQVATDRPCMGLPVVHTAKGPAVELAVVS